MATTFADVNTWGDDLVNLFYGGNLNDINKSFEAYRTYLKEEQLKGELLKKLKIRQKVKLHLKVKNQKKKHIKNT